MEPDAVEVSILNSGIQIIEASNVIVRNLDIEGFRETAVNIDGGSNVTLDNL
jgi:pectate lyase